MYFFVISEWPWCFACLLLLLVWQMSNIQEPFDSIRDPHETENLSIRPQVGSSIPESAMGQVAKARQSVKN